MKPYTRTSLALLALSAIVFTLWSCTKEKVSNPASQQTSVASEDALQPGESLVDTLVPGTYAITKFVDSSVDETAEFDGYTFEFQADHDLIATKDGVHYDGKYRINADETKMAINITGTPELQKLKGKDWSITKLTDSRLIIQRKGPDKVVFKIQ